MRRAIITLLVCSPAIAGSLHAAQVLPDRVDPALVARSLPPTPRAADLDTPPGETRRPEVAKVPLDQRPVTARSIKVEQDTDLPRIAFDAAIAPYIGKALSADELRDLASAVASVARAHGYIFATASVPSQPLSDGVLSVDLDAGRVDAVRSLGASNVAVDRILSRLAMHRGVRREELDRVLLLVGDVPGIRVVSTRYAREDGFGILLVTLALDKISFFAQADNRGTDQIGPWRTTEAVNFHGALRDGDEASVLLSQTPASPREFEFVSGMYNLAAGPQGDVASLSAFYGSTKAGGDLGYLHLTGKIAGGAVGYSMVLHRSPSTSTWLDVNLHVLRNKQRLSGQIFRDDYITTFNGTVRNRSSLAGGNLRASVTLAVGLPLPGMTHEGDPLASRPDGDARFVTGSLEADWTHGLFGPVSVLVSTVGQVASRPLLATAEMSLGGPALGRAYDYSEHSGDQGVAASAELQWDLHRLFGENIFRLLAYTFVDGGTVKNLRDGIGGGTLASTGLGLRTGRGRFDGSAEVAFPINADRLDTQDRSPRISARMTFYL